MGDDRHRGVNPHLGTTFDKMLSGTVNSTRHSAQELGMFGDRSRLTSIAACTTIVAQIGKDLNHSLLRQVEDGIVTAIFVAFPAEGTFLRINHRHLLIDFINLFLLTGNKLRDIGLLRITVG
ncbi:hypothetical protein GGQ94_003178 [Petrimonas sulfuriphila]